MKKGLRIEKVIDSGTPTPILEATDPWRAAVGSERGLRPWLVALCEVFDEELPAAAELEEWLSTLDAEGGADELCGRAADVALRLAKSEKTPVALIGALYLLKTKGVEVGRSPAGHWKLNRLLNAGSRAVDFMLANDHFRRLSLKTLLYRMLTSAVGRASVEKRGVVKELSCGVGWDQDQERVLRRELPPPASSDVELGEKIVDWLLEELLSRGISSVVLGSVIEESREGRRYTLGEEVAQRIGELPADEGRFLAGAVFMPAHIGGWSKPLSEQLLDAFAVAREISEDFVPDEAKVKVYREHLSWVEEKRRIPQELSSIAEIDDGEKRWRGRWAMIVHPPRRTLRGEEGFSALELGFYFDDPQETTQGWSGKQRREMSRWLKADATTEDDRVFSIFAQALDQVVEGINSQPGALTGGPPEAEMAIRRHSPLWAELSEGVEELCRALEAGDRDELTKVLRQWTVEIGD